MDSESGSTQSSSGGEEEYDSHATDSSISAFLSNNNNPTLSHIGPIPNLPPHPPPPDHHHPSSSFDPLSNFFDPLSRSPQPVTNPNSFLNLDMVWSKNLRSEPNCTDLGGLPFMATSSSPSPTQQFFINPNRPTFTPSTQILQGPEITPRCSVSGLNDQTHVTSTTNNSNNSNSNSNNNTTGRNPKKRSRASRRAPTTVLTTDTTNFRAMVQEFTGIPAPPFTSSPFPRTRLDLFGTAAASTLRSVATSHLDPSPPYLLRPFAQKVQPPPSLPTFLSHPSTACTSMVDAIASTARTNNISSVSSTNSTTSNSSTSINYQLPQNQLLNVNMQNPILNFHSVLHSSSKYPLPNSTILAPAAKPSLEILSSNESHHKMGSVLEEFGLNSHDHVSTNLSVLQNMHTTLPRSDNPTNWGSEGTGLRLNEGDHSHQGLLRSVDGVSNGKVGNYSGSSSDFLGDKGPIQNVVATRSEGMVESWICSSD